MTQTFKSFKDLARTLHAEDVRKAQNLKRSANLRNGKRSKPGPAVAR